MPLCKHCGKDQKTVPGCAKHDYVCGGKTFIAVLYGDEREGYVRTGSRPPAKCHDCHAEIGKHHHPGCPIERCPVCSGQLTNCGCTIKPVFATPPATA